MKATSQTTSRALLPLIVLLAAISLGASGSEPDSETFAGHYDWSDGGKDDLRVEFTPQGDDKWDVTFRFGFDGRAYAWQGTAEGRLEDASELTGTASWKSRRWTWRATIEDGVMLGEHTELRSRGRTRDTGTFELRASSD